MSISLPVIDNMFAGAVAVDPRRSKPTGTKSTDQLGEVPTGAPFLPDMPATGKTYNKPGNVGDEPADELLQDSESMLGKKTTADPGIGETAVTTLPRTPSEGTAKTQQRSQNAGFVTVPGSNAAQLASAKESLPDAGQAASAGSDKSVLPGHRSVVAGTLAGVVTQKAQVSDDYFSQIHKGLADTEQKTGFGPQKSAFSGEKPADDTAPVDRGPKPNLSGTAGQIFSDSVDGKGQAGNPSDGPLAWHSNMTEFRVAAGQPKNGSNLGSRRSSSTDFTRAISADNTHISVSEPRSGCGQPAKAAHAALPSGISSTMSQQITESVRASLQQGDQSITIRLHPPELGKVVVRFQEQEDQIAGSLEVSKAQTRYEIDQALPQVIQALRDSGVRIDRFDVLLMDESERQPHRDDLPQNGSFQQHYSAEGDTPDSKSGYEHLADMPNSSYQGDPEPQMQIGDNCINMLV